MGKTFTDNYNMTKDDTAENYNIDTPNGNYNNIDGRQTNHRIVAAGTGDIITGTISNLQQYYNGLGINFIVSADNTGATTININGLGAKDVKKAVNGSLVALIAFDLALTDTVVLRYDLPNDTFIVESVKTLAEKPICDISLTSNQSTNNNTFTPIEWTTVVKDNRSQFSLGDPTKVIIKEARRYLIILGYSFVSNATGNRQSKITINAGNIRSTSVVAVTGSVTRAGNLVSKFLQIGDEIVTEVKQDSGGTLNIEGAASATFLQVLAL